MSRDACRACLSRLKLLEILLTLVARGRAGARQGVALAGVALILLAGCSSVVNTGAGEIAGVAGAGVADALTTNAGVAAGIGLGAQAAARAGVQYTQRRVHRAAQDQIARTAGPLKVGQVAEWRSAHKEPLEDGEHGRVTVSRVVSVSALQCKEIVFSVDSHAHNEPHSAFYVAMVCRDGPHWRWASAEPATDRWSGLQ
jgi:hypothetical protein